MLKLVLCSWLARPTAHTGLAAALLIVSVACADSHDRGPGHAAAGDAGPSGSDAGTLVADCAPKAPTSGERCDEPGLNCEYGDDWSPKCNTLAQCWIGGGLDGTWQVREPSTADCPTPTPLVPGCPTTPPTGSCSPSDPSELCVYDSTRCLCFPFESGAPGGSPTYMWTCQDPPGPGCPATRPRIGSACTTEGQRCIYAVCGLGGGTHCDDGVWSEAIVPNACASAG